MIGPAFLVFSLGYLLIYSGFKNANPFDVLMAVFRGDSGKSDATDKP